MTKETEKTARGCGTLISYAIALYFIWWGLGIFDKRLQAILVILVGVRVMWKIFRSPKEDK